MDSMHYPGTTSTPETGSAMAAVIATLPQPLADQIEAAFATDARWIVDKAMDLYHDALQDNLNQRAATRTATTCQPWCWLHDGEENVCIGEATVLEFPDAGPYFADQAKANLSYSPGEGVTVSVNVGSPNRPLRLDDADAVADLIKAKAAQAREAGAL